MVPRAGEGAEAPVSPNERIPLFNGKDLGGFYTWLVDSKREDPRHVFVVTNGVIRISGEGLGYLATEKEYQDYHLVAEFKWGKTNWPWGGRTGKARDTERFRDAGVFQRIFDETGAQLKAQNLAQGQRLRRVTVSSFSAGFGGVRELLKNEAVFDRIDALVMADSFYAGYTGGSGTREVDRANMEAFLNFARAAARGGKRMIISHSQQRPHGYASTTETADYLISRLGGARETVAETWPGGLRLLSRFRKGGLEIYGLAGDTGADHMKHLQQLSALLERSCE